MADETGKNQTENPAKAGAAKRTRTIDLQAREVGKDKSDSIREKAGKGTDAKAQSSSSAGDRFRFGSGLTGSRRLLRTAVAGGTGGVIVAILLLAGIWLFGPDDRPDPALQSGPAIEELREQQAALAQRLTELGGAFEQQYAVLAEDLRRQIETAIEPAGSRLAELSDAMEQLQEDGVPAADPDLLARVEALENRPVPANGGGQETAGFEAMEELSSRVDALEAAVALRTEEFAEMRQQLVRIEQLGTTLASRAEEISRLDAARADAALGLALAALREAYEAGESYRRELERIGALRNEIEIPPLLARHAASGIEGNSQLLRELETAYRDVQRAVEPAPEGIVGQVLNSARSLVTIRPAGPMEGDDPLAILSRIEEALARDEPAAALQLLEELPPAAQSSVQSLAEKLRERVAADRALDEFVQTLTGNGVGVVPETPDNEE